MMSLVDFFTLLVLVNLIGVLQTQKLILLKNIKGNNTVNSISDGTTAVYATATTDNVDWLKQIWIVSSESGKISIYDLTQRRKDPTLDLMNPWISKGVTTLTTSLDDIELNLLRGFIYCTSEKQSNDSLFRVYEVSQLQMIYADTDLGNHTTVFLNSRMLGFHMQSTTFTRWQQQDGTLVEMYQNIPMDNPEKDNTQIFSNPMIQKNEWKSFSAINPFSVTLGAFYLRLSGSGQVVFFTSPDYYDIDSTTTSAVTSTGFYMKAATGTERKVTVSFAQDSNYNGTCGFNAIADIPQHSNVTITINRAIPLSFTFGRTYDILPFTTLIGNSMSISSVNTAGGQYFVQYFTIQDQVIVTPATEPTTSSAPSMTPTPSSQVQTSTKSTGKLNNCVQILFSTFVACLVL